MKGVLTLPGQLPPPWQREWMKCRAVYRNQLLRRYPMETVDRWAFEDVRDEFLRRMTRILTSQARPS